MKNLSPSWLFQFKSLVRLGSFTEAALEFNLTQQALSRNIKMLEAWAGQRLIQRMPGGLALTPAGSLLLQEVPGLLQQLQRICIPALDPNAVLRVGVVDFFGDCFLPEVLLVLLAWRPELKISILPLQDDEIHARLLAGELDMGLILFEPEPGLEARALPEIPWVLAGTLRPAPASGFDLVKFTQGGLPGPEKLQALPQPVRQVGSTDSMRMLREMLLAGLGAGCILRPYVREDLELGRLIRYDHPGLPSVRPSAVWFRDISRSEPLNLLLDLLEQEMQR